MTIPLQPQLAAPSTRKNGRSGPTIADLEGTHSFELKIDGIRGLIQWDGTEVTIWNRNGVVVTDFFPEVRDGIRAVAYPEPFLLDGELVLINPQASFNDLCKRIKGSTERAAKLALTAPAWFIAFDVLRWHGADLLSSTYLGRRMTLEGIVGAYRSADCPLTGPWITLVPSSPNGQQMWQFVQDRGLEGLIAKRHASHYLPGKRTPDWTKFKTTRRLTCVAIGYEPGNGAREKFGAMHVALVGGDKPVYVGRVGTGFNASDITWMMTQLDTGQMPLVDIECLGRTRDNKLRFPVYIGPRTDLTLLDAHVDQLDALPLQ